MIPLKHNEHMNQLKKIYILESVFDTEVLHDGGEAMEKQLSPICQANGVELKRLVFYSLREFLAEQKNILDSSNADEAIAIHLICHGADNSFVNGLVYKIEPDYIPMAKQLNLSASIICHSWDALRASLQQINEKCNGNLFASMCVCYGANIFKECKVPFAKYTIASENVLYLNDIKQPYIDIYKQLIASNDTEPVKALIEADNQKHISRSQLSVYDGIVKIL